MTAEIASKGCKGCGICTDICPSIFQMNKKIYAEVIERNVPISKEKQVKEATKHCPVSVITLA
ncbi:MAG: ferredoxin [Anaerocolumna sp.]